MTTDQVPAWMTQEAIDTLSRGYLLPGETPRDMWRRVCSTAAKILNKPEIEEDFFEMFWRGYFGGATPVLSNMGTTRGLTISCFGVAVSDSVQSIYSHLKEVAALSKNGGGVGVYYGDIRCSGSPITGGGKSTGVVPWIRQYDQCASVVSQGGVRRGSFAMYLPISHPDLPELLRAKDHSQGDPRNFIDSNIAVVIDNDWIKDLLAGDVEKKKLFGEVLKMRLISGSPYITFIDNANDANPECYVQRGLTVKASQLCNEILLYNDENHTYVCVLSSLNLARYDEWKNWRGSNTGKTAPELAVYFLDAVVEEFINRADRIPSMGRAVRFAKKSRALGLGTMGLHALYQSRGLPFKSDEARALNVEAHKYIQELALKASQDMAKEYGEPEWCEGNGIRHTHLTAIAPTKTNSSICGAVSEGIEPIFANTYTAKQAKGTFTRRNPYLEAYLDKIGHNTREVWKSIEEARGSVQHLTNILDERAREVFKTVFEIDQFEIVRQASDRQPYVSQGQSVNLFVDPNIEAKELIRLHLAAWAGKLKGLYYLKSTSLLVKKNTSLQAKVYTKPGCPYCVKAKELLRSKGYQIQEADSSSWPGGKFPYATVPQIWLTGEHIGGYSDLTARLGAEPTSEVDCLSCQG